MQEDGNSSCNHADFQERKQQVMNLRESFLQRKNTKPKGKANTKVTSRLN